MSCRRCGVCCTRHQAYVRPEELGRIIAFLRITGEDWEKLYNDPGWEFNDFCLIRHMEGGCAFLRFEQGLASCAIYPVRPACCSDWQPGPDRKECREGMKRAKKSVKAILKGDAMNTRTIRQTVTIKATPHDVYEALMDSKKHAAFTGGKASISRMVGGKFTAYDGYAEGVNVELVPDKKIVQTWRADDWPEGHYSRVTFSLTNAGGGTRLAFTQSDVLEEQYDDVAQGWRDYYWKPLKEMLEK